MTSRAGAVGRSAEPSHSSSLLVALALAGLFVGRTIRDGGGDQTATPTTAAAASTTARPRPAPASPRGERWGPLRAIPAGRLVAPAVRSAAVASGASVVVLGGAAGNGGAGRRGRAACCARWRRFRRRALRRRPSLATAPSTSSAASSRTRPRATRSSAFDVASHRVTSAGTFVEPLAGAGLRAGRRLALPRRRLDGREVRDRGAALHAARAPPTSSRGCRRRCATRPSRCAAARSTSRAAARPPGSRNAVYVVDLASGTVSVLGRLPHPVVGRCARDRRPLSSTCSAVEDAAGPGRGGRPHRPGERADRACREDAAPACGRRDVARRGHDVRARRYAADRGRPPRSARAAAPRAEPVVTATALGGV